MICETTFRFMLFRLRELGVRDRLESRTRPRGKSEQLRHGRQNALRTSHVPRKIVWTRLVRLLLVVAALCGLSRAITQTSGDFLYRTNGGVITITGYTGPGGAVLLPAAIRGMPVTSIKFYAFSSNANITQITIPDPVASIGYDAFNGCESLATVSIPEAVTNIGWGAFSECPSLTSFTVAANNASYSSDGGVLYNKAKTRLVLFPTAVGGSYIIPETVTEVGVTAFEGDTGLTNIVLPDRLISIRDATFDGCSGLTSIVIPDSVTYIGTYAFDGCRGLTSIIIPDSVTNIGSDAFAGCNGLTNITIPEGLPAINWATFSGCYRLSRIRIPDTVTSIGDDAFDGCSSLTKVVIPDRVTGIGEQAFYNCGGLRSATIGEDVVGIGGAAFSGCFYLKGIFFKGNAPRFAGGSIEFLNSNPILYYLPGTTGWETVQVGVPIVLWNPHLQVSHLGLGTSTNGFEVKIRGTPDIPVVLEASSNLGKGGWVPLASGSLTNAQFTFRDRQWPHFAARFYRVRSP